MCGIAVIMGAEQQDASRFAERATVLLNHRGPDGKGMYVDDEVTLIHRRLAILDLGASGHQPMLSKEGRFVMVYNGEIYNHLELRKQFLKEVEFNGHSDTETLLALYVKMGEEMLPHLLGMWAMVIWDKKEKTLFISRDRLGQKPLYYRWGKDGSLALASEMKPLLYENEQPSFNATAVVEYLSIGNYGHLDNRTFFDDIFHFRQGHYTKLSFKEKRMEEQSYWTLPKIEDADKLFFSEEERKKLYQQLEYSVQSQLLSDVKVSATLSGGLDSSIVVGFMAKDTTTPIDVFTAQSAGSRWDESKYVQAVQDKWGSERLRMHWKELSTIRLSKDLIKYVRIQEEPFGDPSIIAHGHLMEMAKAEGVKVVLSGQGADELVFGYPNMMAALLSLGIRKKKWNWVLNNLEALRWPSKEVYRIFLGGWFPSLEQRLRKISRAKRRHFIRKALIKEAEKTPIKLSNVSDFYSVWEESAYGVHLPHLLHYDDRNSMSCSIEGRMPFMDHRTIEMVARISPVHFLEEGKNKQILRKACAVVLPQMVLDRKDKIGFYTPLIQLLKEETDWIEQTLSASERINGIVDTKTWQADVEALKKDTVNLDQALRLWRILCLTVWLETFQVSYQR